jgi:ferredoxin-NADP reductase/DMSO/TMAO reductase YedYZ heme-binding membrane subunit
MNEPQIWWYVTRASAVIAWVLLTVAVLWGVLLSTRVLRKIDNPSWLQDLHRYLGGTAVIMVGLHMVSLVLDSYAHFSIEELLVPFAIEPRFAGLPIALGILAFYILVAVQASSYLKNRIPPKVWKGIHYASYAAVVAVSFHAGFSSSKDVSQFWYQSLAIILVGLGAAAAITRILVGSRVKTSSPTNPRTTSLTRAKPLAQPGTKNPAPTAPSLSADTRSMRVASVDSLTPEVKRFTLVDANGERLPVWHPGAHLTIHLADGRTRQYSLCGDPADRTQYEIAVLRIDEPGSGSSWVHEHLAVDSEVLVSGPRNHFELEPASEYVFVAGGIGITPIKAMIESLPERRKWTLHYFGRSRSTMAFLSELVDDYPESVVVWARDERGDADVPMTDLLTKSVADAQVYCCGPESLMSALALVVDDDRLHLERFVALDRLSGVDAQPVEVTCRKSRQTFVVGADESLLDAMETRGVPIMGSCRTGVCGTCEVRVVQGTPQHLDSVMSDADKDELGVMYPCVSRAVTDKLVLDV